MNADEINDSQAESFCTIFVLKNLCNGECLPE